MSREENSTEEASLSEKSQDYERRKEEMAQKSIFDVLKETTGLAIGCSILMLALGVLAILMPFATGVGVSILVGWLMVFGGFAYFAYAFAAQAAGSFFWRLLVAILYVVGGGYLAFHPGIALETLTLLLAGIFLVEGVMEIVVFFRVRSMPRSGWILFDGIIGLVLAYLIWRPWPSSSLWAIGTILGVNLIVSGVAWLSYSITARKTLNAMA